MSSDYDITSVRNVALISHGGGGKTTLAEAMLFNGKAIPKRGKVERGDTVMTTEPEELERGVTITPHVGRLAWQGVSINLVDTPGYVDFLESTRGVLHVVGGAVMLISGISGVKAENERLWEMAQEAMVPVIGFINKMDLPRSDFIRTLGQIEQGLGVDVLPIVIPIGAGKTFSGIIDLLPMTAWSAKDGVFTQIPFPEAMRKDAEHYRTALVEKIVETDEELLEKYLEDGTEPAEEALHRGLREAVLTRRLFLTACGSGAANIGVRALLNAIARYLPSPTDKANIKPLIGVDPLDRTREILIHPSTSEPFAGVVFKTVIDPFAGKLSVLRVFSGTLEAGRPLFNATRQEKERGGALFKLQGKEMTPVERLFPGEIGAAAKLETAHTGDTLCDPARPIHFQRVEYLDPIMTYAVEVDSKTEAKISVGLIKLVEEDPTLRFSRDEESNEILLSGMGQTHLSVTLDRLKRKFGATAVLKTQRVPYRETIRKKVRVQGKLKKQSGGRGQFGDCWIEMEPLHRGEGFSFEDRVVGGVIPRQFIPSVEKGIREALLHGIVGGFPVVDVKVALVDGTHHSVDSSDYAFKVAGSLAFKKAMEEGEAVLLEPMMSMLITVPDEVVGDVIGDLNSRRGRITGVVTKANSQQINAEAPMAELLDYGQVLNGLTSGRGLYTMTIANYQEAPSHIARKVLEGHQPPARNEHG
ncbi:MAG: elongation factor G [Magnetococcales bacterium]|nr:elongation factor G [Magnetococcales bacterium]